MRGIRGSGYSQHGASRSKTSMLMWQAISKSPHEDISENLEVLRSRSRDLYAGSPLGRGAIERVVLNALGAGLRLNVRIDGDRLGMREEEAQEWASRVESEFDYWASSKDSDYSRVMNFYELQVLALRSVLLDGECLVALPVRYLPGKPYGLSVLLIESERLGNPPVREAGVMIDEGVELDQEGKPRAYWIATRNPESELSNQPRLEYRRVELHGKLTGRRNILHLLPMERIGQHRGVPYLSPVIESLKQLSRYTEAELMAAVVSGMYSIFFTHEPVEEGALGEEEYASEGGIREEDERKLTRENMYGAVMDLPAGVKPVTASPGRPNTSFDAFVLSLVRQIGGALGIPAELLFLHFTASYSASRGALLEAWKLFKYWRVWFGENFCQAIYEEWLDEAVLSGRIRAPGYYEDDVKRKGYAWAEWVGPSQGQLNPVQEVQASILKVENGFSTYQRETGELTGEDYDLVEKQLRRERRMRNVPDSE